VQGCGRGCGCGGPLTKRTRDHDLVMYIPDRFIHSHRQIILNREVNHDVMCSAFGDLHHVMSCWTAKLCLLFSGHRTILSYLMQEWCLLARSLARSARVSTMNFFDVHWNDDEYLISYLRGRG
jgi:hypothetical protein